MTKREIAAQIFLSLVPEEINGPVLDELDATRNCAEYAWAAAQTFEEEGERVAPPVKRGQGKLVIP